MGGTKMKLQILCRENIVLEGILWGNNDVQIHFNGKTAILDQEEARMLKNGLERFISETDSSLEYKIEKLTYEQVLELKYDYETELYCKPKLVCSGVFYRKDDKRILQPAIFLAECDIPYSEKKYKDYLSKRSIPYKYLLAINKNLADNYEQLKK
jgi:hypothetical protein